MAHAWSATAGDQDSLGPSLEHSAGMTPLNTSMVPRMRISRANAHRQLKNVVRNPPKMGPTATPSAFTPPMIPYDLARASPLRYSRIAVCTFGSMRAAPTP